MLPTALGSAAETWCCCSAQWTGGQAPALPQQGCQPPPHQGLCSRLFTAFFFACSPLEAGSGPNDSEVTALHLLAKPCLSPSYESRWSLPPLPAESTPCSRLREGKNYIIYTKAGIRFTFQMLPLERLQRFSPLKGSCDSRSQHRQAQRPS